MRPSAQSLLLRQPAWQLFSPLQAHCAGSQIAVEFSDPDGPRREIFGGLDTVGIDGRVRPAAEWKWAHSLEDAVDDPAEGQDTTVGDRSLLRRRSDDDKRRNLEQQMLEE